MQQRTILLAYARAKLDDEDFHGVCDACNDLREIDAELRGLRCLADVRS
jgi:hypothetical protein